MRLLLQKVLRAAVEVDGVVETRIGPGLSLQLGVGKGDSVKAAEELAEKVLSLALWPELLDQESAWGTTISDNGFEIMVMLQQSLCSTFPKKIPSSERAADGGDAKQILEAFVGKLRQGYQEEMIVVVPAETSPIRLETTGEGGGIFELTAGAHTGGPRPPAPKAKAKAGVEHGPPELKPELSTVTRTLQNLATHSLSRSKALLDSARAFNAINSEAFRSSLAESAQYQVDAFAAALEQAARFFTASQRQRIMAWTGMTFSNEALAADLEADEEGAEQEPDADAGVSPDEEELKKQLAELRGEVDDRFKGISAAKRRRIEDGTGGAARSRPDWNGRAAPETPAAIAARAWAARRAGVRGPQPPTTAPWANAAAGRAAPVRRSWGIASLDTSSRLHGKGAGGFAKGQLSQHADTEQFQEGKMGGGGYAKQQKPGLRLPKGLPTVAPMTPAPTRSAAEI